MVINVTKAFLPPKQEYQRYLEGIWERQWLTNNGPLVNEYELKLKEYLGVKHILYVSNGTIALQIAIKALELKGEIITTPFSYVATTSSIVWEGCKPIFVDIDEETFNIDPSRFEEAITENTSAIIATHCFGNPCDIDAIDAIAKKHNLKVIYDASHCFGSKYKGRSVFEYGDISTLSLHATKLVHSVEGGAVFTQNPELLKKMAYMRNFGHDGPEHFNGVGINGKNSEFHAAMGLAVLGHSEEILKSRKNQWQYYLQILDALNVTFQRVLDTSNYAYFPIVFESEEQMHKSLDALNAQRIFPRRYFYPTLSSLEYIKTPKNTPIADSVASRILCLPLYHGLGREEQDLIRRILLRTQNN